jgi:hypothetical protein
MKKQVNGMDVKLKKNNVTRCAYTQPIPVFLLVSANTKPVTRNEVVNQFLTFNKKGDGKFNKKYADYKMQMR